MARKRIALRQFAVSTEQDDGGVEFTHSYRQCDWHEWVDGMSPGDLLRIARAHAKVCDGKPQPRPERTPYALGGVIPGIWSKSLHAALERRLADTTAIATGRR